MSVEVKKLIQMGEQIVVNLSYSNDEEQTIERVRNHLQRFWDPRMRSALADYARLDDPELSAILREASRRLS